MEPQRFRKKPVMVEAIQWTGCNDCELTAVFGEAVSITTWTFDYGYIRKEAYLTTKKKSYFVSINDWILRYPDGSLEICKPNVFEQEYDRLA